MSIKNNQTDQSSAQDEHKRPNQSSSKKPGSKSFHHRGYDRTKKDPNEIPILRYGPNNNFHLFREALSKRALKDYGDLGKLIKEGQYHELQEPKKDDYEPFNDPDGINKLLYLEDMKEWKKENNRMRRDRTKLYALILQYLSEESLEAVKRQDNWDAIEKSSNAEGLWKQQMRQGAYESIITYKERFTNALKAYEEQGNVKLNDEDIAMDFFRGLDNGRYATFKTEVMNLLTTQTLQQPKDLNSMYLLASQWLKPNTRTSSSTATTFATSVSTISHRRDNRGSNSNKNRKNGGKKRDDKNEVEKDNSSMCDNNKEHVECFYCGENGHYANKCLKRNMGEEKQQQRHANATWHASTFTSHYVYASGDCGEKFGPTEVLLDNQSDISVVKPSLLRNLQPAERSVIVNGAGGSQFTASDTGYLQDFFTVYASEDTHANILSFAEVEDTYPISYVPRESFTVHLPERDITFYRRGKHYIADWNSEMNYSYTTTGVYTKAEEARAKGVFEFLKKSGYPSEDEAIHLIEDGNIIGMPSLTRHDVRRAYEIYGVMPEYVRGKMTKKVASRAVLDDSLILDEKKQSLYTDVMHIDGNKFLVTVCEPLQLTLQCKIERENQNALGMALQGQLDLLRSHSFVPTIVYADPQGAFKSMTNMFPGVIIDVSGAGDHVWKVDAKIRRIKELYRSVKSGLMWQLPNIMVRDLVAYCVSRLNIKRTTAINTNICPRVLFTGIKINFEKELGLAFGDYVEVYDGTDNTSRPRSIPCIALYPCANSTGSWEFMNLLTKRKVRRSQWKLMKTNELIVNTMNTFDSDDQNGLVNLDRYNQTRNNDADSNNENTGEGQDVSNETVQENNEVDTNQPDQSNPSVDNVDNSVLGEINTMEVSSGNSTEDVLRNDNEENREQQTVEEVSDEEHIPARRSGRVTRPPSRYAFAIKVLKDSISTKERRKAIDAAEITEILLLFCDLQALHPVYKESISTGTNPLNCHMFTVEKFKASGEFDKMKSRLVANGNEQDPEIYHDSSSPTAAIHSIFTSLLVAAVNISYKLAKIDVKGAFVQTRMKGPDVFIKCRPNLTRQIVKVLPGLEKYVTDGLSKPLVGDNFTNFRNTILGTTMIEG